MLSKSGWLRPAEVLYAISEGGVDDPPREEAHA